MTITITTAMRKPTPSARLRPIPYPPSRAAVPCNCFSLSSYDAQRKEIEAESVNASRMGRSNVLCTDDGLHVAAHVPVGHDLGAARLNGRHKVVQDLVRDGFVKDVLIPISIEVKLEGSQLDDRLVRHVSQGDGGEVGISGAWTLAGELRRAQLDTVVALRSGIGKRFQLGLSNGCFPIAMSFCNQER